MMSLNAARTASNIETASAQDFSNRPNFEASLTPMEFVNKYGQTDAKLDETKNRHKLVLSCRDSRGIDHDAYASAKLQSLYEEARNKGEEFALPESALVAPRRNNDGWVLYLQAERDYSTVSGKISQTLNR